MELNNQQIELLIKYCRGTVQNNQEIHPLDMPEVVSMFRLLAERGYSIDFEQIDDICDSLRSMGNKTVSTSDSLRSYLRHVAEVYNYQVNGPHRGKFKRDISKIADDIVSENDVEYYEE